MLFAVIFQLIFWMHTVLYIVQLQYIGVNLLIQTINFLL